jgi:ribosomal protein S15P/S13E
VSEGLWLQRLLLELGQLENKVIILYYDNEAAINIINNQIQYNITKHMKIDRQDKYDKYLYIYLERKCWIIYCYYKKVR